MMVRRALGLLGAAAIGRVAGLGSFGLTVGGALVRAPRMRLRELADEVVKSGVKSLPLTIAMSLFAGMVMAYQFGSGLERFGAKLYIGQTTVTALFRELGPVLTALVAGARVTAGIAAELGGMAVTEQIDAVRALGADPRERLVAPRLLAAMVALPLLSIVTDVVGAFGAIVIAWVQYGIGPGLFLHGVYDFVTIFDFLTGLIKGAAFGVVVGSVACFYGVGATGGQAGVGRAATRAVVTVALAVLVVDFVLTKALLRFM
jgi:phospholipid/cholesterol/gamma-HCH transport system permease protein